MKKLVARKYFQMFLLSLPIITVAVFTLSRALFISVPFILIYFSLNNLRSNLFKIFLYIIIFSVGFIFLFSFIRSSDLSSYPLARDISIFDYYYSLKNYDELNTNFSNLFRLLLTGLPFNDYFTGFVYDINYKLADFRIRNGWGSLHPTFFGWIFIDGGWYGLVYCIFFGVIIGLFDRLSKSLPHKLSVLFLPFQLSFIPVLVRGSVQYAYSNIIYIFIVFVLVYFIQKRRFIFGKI
ncbi:hypothetical protein [Cyclobacterium xiamenense]|uniref:hypothetical protein n=1 Tax=Cyclobacterium xiamenense TaxID=1297121 RepID=UPI0012B7ED13|nr:hypothetical protein [Cyclobacterium xiamenense]